MAINLTYDLVNYTPADASPVEANFNRIEQYVNQELIVRDGTVAMTADLQLAQDPATALAAATKQYVDAILPIGIVMQYGGSVLPPSGRWALCDGTALATASYPALFAVIGYSFGGSGGSFSLPNLTGRVTVGAGTGNVLAATGGSRDAVVANHTHPIDHGHTVSNSSPVSVDHTHAVSIASSVVSADHYHNLADLGTYFREAPGFGTFYVAVTAGGGFDIQATLQPASAINTGGQSANHFHNVDGNTAGQSANHFHTVTPTPMTGSSGAASGGVAPAEANMPPYVVMNSIMRVA